MYLQLNKMDEVSEWQKLSAEEKKKQLFLDQKKTLDIFLERNAISAEQYQKSLTELTLKMGMHGVKF